jgi:hypothetical protein
MWKWMIPPGGTYFIIMIYSNCNGLLPSGSGTTIRHNIQMHIPYKIIHHAQRNTAHRATQTINTHYKQQIK